MEQHFDAKRTKHKRKRCGHCDEILSYSAYKAHKNLYYDDAERQWRRCDSLSIESEALHVLDSSDDVDQDQITEILAKCGPSTEAQPAQDVSSLAANETAETDETSVPAGLSPEPSKQLQFMIAL